jgi:hypothetical protein
MRRVNPMVEAMTRPGNSGEAQFATQSLDCMSAAEFASARPGVAVDTSWVATDDTDGAEDANRPPHAEITPTHEPFEPGTHIVTGRGLYTHHGIYVGSGRVVHYAGLSDGWRSGPIEEVSLDEFANGELVVIRAHASRSFSSAEIVARARSRLGENTYHLLRNNCEHFCEWCFTGRKRSWQVQKWMSLPGRLLRSACRWCEEALDAVAAAGRHSPGEGRVAVRKTNR